MDFAFLFIDWLGKPLWMWLAFISIVIALLVFDLGILHRDNREIEVRESLALSSMYIGLGLAFGVWVWWQLGPESGMNYLTGFVVEKTLALDNVFVIALIFSFFAVPRKYQHRVLFWGILGVSMTTNGHIAQAFDIIIVVFHRLYFSLEHRTAQISRTNR